LAGELQRAKRFVTLIDAGFMKPRCDDLFCIWPNPEMLYLEGEASFGLSGQRPVCAKMQAEGWGA